MNMQISRRHALLGSGALVVSFSLRGSVVDAQAQGAAKPLAVTEVDSFLAIDKAGNVTAYSGKVDLGTGITTALRQIVAEELDVPTSRIELVQGDTSLTPDQGTTWGSLTIQVGGMQLRQAAAAARQALMAEAAKKLGTDQLTVADGVVSGGGKKVSYGELIGGKNFAITLDPKQPVKEKAPKDYKVVGKSQARVDIPDKIMGRFTYMQDFKVPGMLHGRVVRPPAIGAKLENVDDGAVKKIPGIVKVVREGNFLAIVASNEWDAIRGADALKPTWSKSETLPDQAKLWDYVRNSKVAKLEEYGKTGDTGAALAADGVKKISATYD
ncbi:MAG: molybdopterin cofactor-binding domain-containing protein, partial [Pseudolabrys sp.]